MQNKERSNGMYKKKELLGILKVCENNPEIDTRCLQEKIKNGLNTKKPPKLNTKDKEVMAKLYDICIHNGTLQYPARKAMEQILGYSSIEDKYHELGIYTDDEFWEVVSGTAEEIEVGEYGFRTEAAAFGDDTCPANVFLLKYKEKYIVYAGEEMDESGYAVEYLDDLEHELFDNYDDAYQYYQSLLNTGIKSGKEQIRECKEKLKEANHVYIKPYFIGYEYVDFRIYYDRMLIAEHLKDLDSEYISECVEKFHQYCIENKIEIVDIEKNRPWNSNQRYYIVELYDENHEADVWYIHIPSKLQGKQRCLADLITPNNIMSDMW